MIFLSGGMLRDPVQNSIHSCRGRVDIKLRNYACTEHSVSFTTSSDIQFRLDRMLLHMPCHD